MNTADLFCENDKKDVYMYFDTVRNVRVLSFLRIFTIKFDIKER